MGDPRDDAASPPAAAMSVDDDESSNNGGIGDAVELAGRQETSSAERLIFDANDPQIRNDIVRIVIQYLQDEGYMGSAMTLQDESNVKVRQVAAQKLQLRRMRKAILEGDWPEVEKLCAKATFRHQKSFLYGVYRQQYLELIDSQEYQKAFALVGKRLKPLESYAPKSEEFRDMCYLLTCRAVHEAPSFAAWNGVSAAREALVERYATLLDLESRELATHVHVAPHRLLTLLKQALTYQVEFSRYHPRVPPRIGSLLEDYENLVVPNARLRALAGHRGNVKSVCFVGADGLSVATGSSDNTVGLWDTKSGENVCFLRGHTSRVWDIACTKSGDCVVSGGGDGSARVWRSPAGGVLDGRAAERAALRGHDGDIYTVAFHPHENHIVTGGYDKTIRLYDLRTEQLIRTYSGHHSSVSRAVFNPSGSLIISSSKDATIKVWDVLSGLCVKTLSTHLGEVTSVELNHAGTMLLSGSKDNSNRLWDMRLGKPLHRYKGHQNTSMNFVRTSFGPRESLIIGGSEDGFVYLWDRQTTYVLQRLGPCDGPVYAAQWNARQSLLASCGYDGTARLWWFDPSVPQHSLAAAEADGRRCA